MGLIELVTCDNKQYFGNIIYATRCFEPLVKHKPIWRRKTHHKMNMFVIITQCKKNTRLEPETHVRQREKSVITVNA